MSAEGAGRRRTARTTSVHRRRGPGRPRARRGAAARTGVSRGAVVDRAQRRRRRTPSRTPTTTGTRASTPSARAAPNSCTGSACGSAFPPSAWRPIEAMEVSRRRAAAACSFAAYELGERALAWIVENRELHAALVGPLRARGRRIDVLAPCAAGERSRGVRDCARSCACDGSACVAGAAGRRRRRRSLVGARAGRDPASAARLCTDAASSPTSPASTRIAAARSNGFWATTACSRGCRCRADASRSSGRRPTRWRASCSRSRPAALAERVAAAGRARARRARAHHARGGVSAAFLQAAVGRSPIASRSSATRRTACIRWRAGRQSGLRRRGGARGAAGASAAPIGDPGAPHCSCNATRGDAPSRCWPCRPSPTDWCACSMRLRPGCASLRNRGMGAVDALGPLKRLLAQPALRVALSPRRSSAATPETMQSDLCRRPR